ncbi:MAG: 3-dehydroquinate synthase [Gammaproteobacteria bacterium]
MEDVICQRVPVVFEYSVHFTRGLFELDNPLLARVIAADQEPGSRKLLPVVDAGLLRHHPTLLEKLSVYAANRLAVPLQSPLMVPGGEDVKNDPSLPESVHDAIHGGGLCRHSYVLAIGGGAMLDMAGFAAATAHRGVRLIRVPTTVLAQNDSGVGVKNGINAFGKKNFLGSFAPPYAVLNDYAWLTSLEERDWRAGVAEAIKVALIKDANFFAFIAEHVQLLVERDMSAMRELIYRCAELHLMHIATAGDPFETGSSRPLDFGHWSAHKLEQMTDYRLRHGEAVAIGIALDSVYSHLAGLLPRGDLEQVLNVLHAAGLPLYTPELEAAGETAMDLCVFQGLNEFKEHLGGELTITLLGGIGQAIDIHEVDLALYRRAVSELRVRTGTIHRRCTLRPRNFSIIDSG